MKEFAINRAWCTHRAFKAYLLPDEAKVEVSFDPTHWPEDRPKAFLRIETNSPNEPVIRIELTVAD